MTSLEKKAAHREAGKQLLTKRCRVGRRTEPVPVCNRVPVPKLTPTAEITGSVLVSIPLPIHGLATIKRPDQDFYHCGSTSPQPNRLRPSNGPVTPSALRFVLRIIRIHPAEPTYFRKCLSLADVIKGCNKVIFCCSFVAPVLFVNTKNLLKFFSTTNQINLVLNRQCQARKFQQWVEIL